MGAEQSNQPQPNRRSRQMSEAEVQRLLEAQRLEYERKCQQLVKTAANTAATAAAASVAADAATASRNSTPSLEREPAPYQHTGNDLHSIQRQMQWTATPPLYPNLNQAASSSGMHSLSPQNNYNPQYQPRPQNFSNNNYGQNRCAPSAPPTPSAPPACSGRDRSASRTRNNNNWRTEDNSLNCRTCGSRFGLTIFQCNSGHSVCNDCKERGRACRLCGSPITNTRNYELQNIVSQMKQPCPHSDDGCQLYMRMSDMEKHTRECPFREQFCPLRPIFGCYWKGKLNQISDHFENMHPNQHQQGVDTEMRLLNILNTSQEVHLVKIGVYNFLLHIKVSEADGTVSMTVQLIGTQMSASKWLYEVHIYNKSDNRRKYNYTDNCTSSNEPVNDIFREGKCAVLPVAYAKTFINDRDKAMTFKFFIKKTNEERKEFGKNTVYRGRGRGRGRN